MNSLKKSVRGIGAIAVCLVPAVSLGACSSSHVTPKGNNITALHTRAGVSGYGGSARAGGGVNGLISSVSGSTITVKGADGKSTNVAFGDSTKLQSHEPGTKSLITVGTCVNARPSVNQGSSSSNAAANSFIAGTVNVIPASACDGDTTGGFGAAGKVASVSSDSFTMTMASSRQASSDSTPSAYPRKETVTITNSTAFNEARGATAAEIKPGMCVNALGAKKDSKTPARSIVISPSKNGSCG